MKHESSICFQDLDANSFVYETCNFVLETFPEEIIKVLLQRFNWTVNFSRMEPINF